MSSADSSDGFYSHDRSSLEEDFFGSFELSTEEVDDISEELLPFLLERPQPMPAQPPVPPLPPPEGAVNPLNAFRIQGKEFALTYPQCDVLPSVALARILEKVELQELGVTICVVVQEAHTLVLDTVHLHIWLLLDRPLRVLNHQFFDFIADKHGNYQAVRSRVKWLGYVLKAPLLLAQYPAELDLNDYFMSLEAKKSSKSCVISQAIKRGRRNIHVLSDSEPAFVMMNQTKVRDFITLCNDQDAIALVHVPFPIVYPADLPPLSESCNEIYQWVKECVLEPFSRDQVHLRIVGDPGIHKTHFFTLLSSFFHVWHAPYDDGKWMERFDDTRHQVVLFDEYKSQYRIRKLNEFCDGAGYGCPQRNALPFVHNLYTPCIMASNYSWINAYPKALGQDFIALRSVQRRWKEVTFPPGETLLPLCTFLERNL